MNKNLDFPGGISDLRLNTLILLAEKKLGLLMEPGYINSIKEFTLKKLKEQGKITKEPELIRDLSIKWAEEYFDERLEEGKTVVQLGFSSDDLKYIINYILNNI